ncbi:riboflavin synthase [Flexistipes sp.]|uniref:riboflavin synthase n=1 Tax=Flexistipes sp. TaxID=3088135 RepID=UPI002E1DFD36|nr:riboflavin synthase [Flexistipes sp.]
MFTGIIEEVGKVSAFKKTGNFAVLQIECCKILDDIATGDSVSVNGVCLTVTKCGEKSFNVDISYETLEKSSLAYTSYGDPLNLERALTLSTRLGGHLISGHVDCLAKILEIKKESGAYRLRIQYSSDIDRYVTVKGSISLDGISLTVSDIPAERVCEVAVIPHTFENTVLKYKKAGDYLNVEVDMIARYIEKLLKKETKADKLKESILKMQQLEDFL